MIGILLFCRNGLIGKGDGLIELQRAHFRLDLRDARGGGKRLRRRDADSDKRGNERFHNGFFGKIDFQVNQELLSNNDTRKNNSLVFL